MTFVSFPSSGQLSNVLQVQFQGVIPRLHKHKFLPGKVDPTEVSAVRKGREKKVDSETHAMLVNRDFLFETFFSIFQKSRISQPGISHIASKFDAGIGFCEVLSFGCGQVSFVMICLETQTNYGSP